MLLQVNLTLEEKKTKYGYEFTFLYELKSNFQWASDVMRRMRRTETSSVGFG